MVKVGDHIRLSLMKGPDREGVVIAVVGSLVRVRWPSREETMVTPAPGTLTVLDDGPSTTKQAATKPAATKQAAKKTTTKKATTKQATTKKATAKQPAAKQTTSKQAVAKTTGGAKKSAASKRTTKAAKRP